MSDKNRWQDQVHGVPKWYILTSVLYVITGIVMIAWPNLTIDMTGKVIGVGMLVFGLAHIIIYYTRAQFDSIMHMDLTIGVITAAFGAFMLFHADFVSVALPFGVGILLLIGGIMKMQHALDLKKLGLKHWYILLVMSVVLLVIGMILVYNPFKDKILVYFMAGSLILNGILSILSILLIAHCVRRIDKLKARKTEIVINADTAVTGPISDQSSYQPQQTAVSVTENSENS